MNDVICIEESLRTNIFYLAFKNKVGSKIFLQIAPLKIVPTGLEAQDIFSVNTSGHADITEISCMQSHPMPSKQEFLFVGTDNSIMILKLNKTLFLQYFYRFRNVLEGSITDIILHKTTFIACSDSSNNIFTAKLREEFCLKGNMLDYSDFGQSSTINLEVQSSISIIRLYYEAVVYIRLYGFSLSRKTRGSCGCEANGGSDEPPSKW